MSKRLKQADNKRTNTLNVSSNAHNLSSLTTRRQNPHSSFFLF